MQKGIALYDNIQIPGTNHLKITKTPMTEVVVVTEFGFSDFGDGSLFEI